MGYTLRRLAAKCANTYAQKKLSDFFIPNQLGVAVPGGVEAAVHATRHFVENMDGDDVITNAFNCIRRDSILHEVSVHLPEIYPFCHSVYSDTSVLQIGSKVVTSGEGVQQGDPLGPLLFCLTLQPLLNSLSSPLKVGYLDDITLGGPIDLVNTDVSTIISTGTAIGLNLNLTKCEIICDSSVQTGLVISDFLHVPRNQTLLLGVPLINGPALEAAIQGIVLNLPRLTANCLLLLRMML